MNISTTGRVRIYYAIGPGQVGLLSVMSSEVKVYRESRIAFTMDIKGVIFMTIRLYCDLFNHVAGGADNGCCVVGADKRFQVGRRL